MKKILGSPIGLGEVNLTVDNRVRRCIKEYFGNVESEPTGVYFDTIIELVAPDDSGRKKIKIEVSAPEKHLREIFLIKINDVTIHFRPITKVGNKLEGDPVVIADNDWEKIKDSLGSQTHSARLPTTPEEITDANTWEISVNSEATRTEGKEDSQQTDDITDDTVDAMDEEACNKAQCKKWDSDAKVCNSFLKKCEDTKPLEICCVADECKGQKRLQFREKEISKTKAKMEQFK